MGGKPLLIMPKPKGWNRLPLYKKVEMYQRFLGAFHAQFVDKIRVKEIIQKYDIDIHVAKLIRILKDPGDLRSTDLNPSYIIKAAHGSKWNINIRDGDAANLAAIRTQLTAWNRPYNIHLERQYAYIKPRFFLEEKIYDKYLGQNGEALVYMCRCIYGKVVSISVRYRDLRNDYTRDWKPLLPHVEPGLPYVEKPVHLDVMIRGAETLSSPFEFVRMDFYVDREDKIYLSEYTFSPMGGERVLHEELEFQLAQSWI